MALLQLVLIPLLTIYVFCSRHPAYLNCGDSSFYEEQDCGFNYMTVKNQESLKSDIQEIYRSGRSAQSLFRCLPDLQFTSDEIKELLLLCVKFKKFYSFEFIVENFVDLNSKWFDRKMHKAILETSFSVIFMDLLPAKSIRTANKVDLFLKALRIPNVDVVNYITSTPQFINFRRVKARQWEKIFATIGAYGNQNFLDRLLKSCVVDLCQYGHIYILAAAENGNFELVESALASSSIYQHGMENELAVILVRNNQKQLFLKLIRKFALQQTALLQFGYLLLTAICYASFDLFEEILVRHHGSLAFVPAGQSLAIVQADLHNDVQLLQKLKGLDLDDQYPLAMALAADLGFVDKLYAMQRYSASRSESIFNALELLQKFFPLYSVNMKYAQFSDPIQISFFYNEKCLSPSFQSYIGAFDAAERGSLSCLIAFYEHDFPIPPSLEFAAVMNAVTNEHVDVLEFLMKRFSSVDVLCEHRDIQKAVFRSKSRDLLKILIEAWPPACHDLFQLAVNQLNAEGLNCLMELCDGYTFDDHVLKKAAQVLLGSGSMGEPALKVLIQYSECFTIHFLEQSIAAGDFKALDVALNSGRVEVTKKMYLKVIRSRNTQMFELLHSNATAVQLIDWYSSALYACVKQNNTPLVSQLLAANFQLKKHQVRRIWKAAASLQSSEIMNLLSQDARFSTCSSV